MNWIQRLKKTISISFLGTSLAFSPSVIANTEELPEFTEEDIFIDIPQVVSATHLSQKLTEAPASITIIDRDMIDASGALSISDLFRLVPGMQAYDVHTNKHGVTYHGMSNDFPNKLEVMINGRSVYLPLLSTVAWETLDLSVQDVDYIEVVRGSNVPTHGSNAFLGAINIITRTPIKDQTSEISTTQGALGTSNYTLRQAGATDTMQYAVNAGYQSNDGIQLFDDKGAHRYLNFSASFTPSLSDNIDIELGFNDGYSYRGDGDKDTAAEASFLRREHTANYQLIRWNRVQDAKNEFALTYYHNYLNLDAPVYSDDELQLLLEQSFGPLPPGVGELTNDLNPLGIHKENEHGRVHLHDLEFLKTRHISDKSNLVLGAGIRFQQAQSEALFSTNKDWDEETRWRLFGNWEYSLSENWVINTGAMFESSSLSDDTFSPRLAINYLMDDTSSIRTAYTIARRMPSLLDAYGEREISFPFGFGTNSLLIENLDIGAEENHSAEIGYLKLWPQSSTQLDVRLFYEDVNKAIDSVFVNAPDDLIDGESITTGNSASWINKGVEFQIKSKLPWGNDTLFVLNYGYNNPQGNRDRGINRTLDSLDARAPNHTASLLLSTKPTNSSLIGLAYYYMSHTEWLEGYSKESSDNNGYTRADLTLRNTFPLSHRTDLSLSLIVKNLFDRRYSEFYRNNEFDRRTYLQLKLSY